MSRRCVKTSLNMSLNDWIFILGHGDIHRVPRNAQDCSIKRGKRYTIYRALAAFGAVYTGATDAVFKSPAQKKE